MTRRVALLAVLCAALLASPALRAGCVNPPGVNGEAIYNADHNVMQFCDGASWISMAASGSATEVDPRVGTLENGKWCSSNGTIIACTEDTPVSGAGGSSGQVQYNDGIGLGGAAAVTYTASGDLLMLTSQAATDTPLVIKGAEGQTENLQEWRDSSGNVLGVVDANGNVGIGTASPAIGMRLDVAGGSIAFDNNQGIYGRLTNGIAIKLLSVNTSNQTVLQNIYNQAILINPEHTGNVGIGTAVPGQKLSVAGTVESTTGGFKFPDGTTQISAVTGSSQWSDGADSVIYYNSGHVGIGTAFPRAALDVNAINVKFGHIGFVTNYPEILFNAYYDSIAEQKKYTTSASSFSLYHQKAHEKLYVLYAPAGNAGDVIPYDIGMAFDTSGRVGIGTASPRANLEIRNTTAYDGAETNFAADSLTLYGSVGGANGQYFGGITWANSIRRRAGIASVMEHADSDHVGLAFFTQGTDGPGSMAESMRISHGGNVGIGTTNPGAELDVKGTIRGNGYLRLLDADGGATYANFISRDGNMQLFTGGLVVGGYGNDVVGSVGTGNAVFQGNVGIGTANPSSALEVVGTVTATGFSGSGASLTSLNAGNLASGTVATARLGSGTADSSTYLRGDGVWAAAGGIPSGAVMAFNLTSCPTGWSEYTPARGRFIRGIDNGAGNDPDGTRAPGATQADVLGSHYHSVDPPSTNTSTDGNHSHVIGKPGTFGGYYSGPYGNHSTGPQNTGSAGDHSHTVDIAAFNSGSTGSTETRPKNVALLYCEKN